jgi:PilZ domain
VRYAARYTIRARGEQVALGPTREGKQAILRVLVGLDCPVTRNTPKRACMIKNVSEGGACLHIGLLLDPPERFRLTIGAVGNFCRECKLIWRSEFDVGVKFIQRSAQDYFC